MLAFFFLVCLFGTIHAWCPDPHGVCTCSGVCDDGTITCIIDGTLPSLQPGNSDGQGTCSWQTVNLIINSIPVLDSSIFNPGFSIAPSGSLNIHQNSSDPIPFDTQPFMSNLNIDYGSVSVTSLSGPLPFAAFDIDQFIVLSFEGSFTIDTSLPLWKYPSSLERLTLNSSVYSDLPSNVFENLQSDGYAIDIYNFTVIKSNMFNNIGVLQFCNVERIESFAVNNSNIYYLSVNRPSSRYGYPPCTKEASVSVIEAHAFHNMKIDNSYDMFMTVSADSEIHDQCFDTQSIRDGTPLDLKIKIETNNTIRCDSIGHLTKFFNDTRITVETSTSGLSISNEVCGNELNITYNGNCRDAEFKLDKISSFHLVTQLRLSGSDECNVAINLTTHFPNLSQLKYQDVCDDSLLILPSPSTIDLEYLDSSDTHPDPLHLVFRAEQFSSLNLTNILQSTQPINCSCSISWMIQLRECHSNKGGHSVDNYLSQVECANQKGTVTEYLLSDTCCNSTELPTPIPNCNGSHTLPPALLTFDHKDLPQCTTSKDWRFDPCDVQMFYDNPLTTRSPPTTTPYLVLTTTHISTPATPYLTSTTTLPSSTPATRSSIATHSSTTSSNLTSSTTSLTTSTTGIALTSSTTSIPSSSSTISGYDNTTQFSSSTAPATPNNTTTYITAIIVSLLIVIAIGITLCVVCRQRRSCLINNQTVHVEVINTPPDPIQLQPQRQQTNEVQMVETNPRSVVPNSELGYEAGRDYLIAPPTMGESYPRPAGPSTDAGYMAARDHVFTPPTTNDFDDATENEYDQVSYRSDPSIAGSSHQAESHMEEDYGGGSSYEAVA